MTDFLLIGFQTFVLIALAQRFVCLPISFGRFILAVLKTYVVFFPFFIVLSLNTDRLVGWSSLMILPAELSIMSILVVLAVKALLLHFDTKKSDQ